MFRDFLKNATGVACFNISRSHSSYRCYDSSILKNNSFTVLRETYAYYKTIPLVLPACVHSSGGGWHAGHETVSGLGLCPCPDAGAGCLWAAIALSYLFLSRAVTGIPVGVTFAFWEGLGLTCITIGSILFLDEALTMRRATGLACVLAGALLVNQGTDHGKARTPAPTDTSARSSGTITAGGNHEHC